jgi:hypothetical protein
LLDTPAAAGDRVAATVIHPESGFLLPRYIIEASQKRIELIVICNRKHVRQGGAQHCESVVLWNIWRDAKSGAHGIIPVGFSH